MSSRYVDVHRAILCRSGKHDTRSVRGLSALDGERPMSVRPQLRRQLLAGHMPEWLRKHSRMKRVIKETLSAPDWVDRKALRAIYNEARRKTEATGIKHVVDHDIPVDNPRVCGLTVPWNLKVVPQTTNANKSNAWCEWHGDLFSEPEQLALIPGLGATREKKRRNGRHLTA